MLFPLISLFSVFTISCQKEPSFFFNILLRNLNFITCKVLPSTKHYITIQLSSLLLYNKVHLSSYFYKHSVYDYSCIL